MNVPGGDKALTDEEIVRFIDVSAADVVPGWVPSEYYEEATMVAAYKEAQRGDPKLYNMMIKNKMMASLIMTAEKVSEHYNADNTTDTFDRMIESIIGHADLRPSEVLATFLVMRSEIMAQKVSDWDKPQMQLAMFQIDSFMIGYLLGKTLDA